MTRPTARVLALLELLQAGGARTVPDLAGRLGVDERTVRRYVAHLVDLDVPVESVRGRYGGIRLMPGYRMPPLMLTDDEALAVLLGLLSTRRAGPLTSAALAVESATAKIRRVLPKALAPRLDALLEGAHFTAGAEPAVPSETETPLVVAEALRDRRPLATDYTGADGRHTRRTLHPFGIVAHSGRWYLVAADAAHGEVRTFRMDRLSSPRPLEGTFDVPEGFDASATLLASLARAPHRHVVTLRVDGRPDEVAPLLPPGIAVVEDDAEVPGWSRVRIHAERLDWVPAVLAGIDRPFVVDEPDALRPLLRSLAGRLADAADGGEVAGDDAVPAARRTSGRTGASTLPAGAGSP